MDTEDEIVESIQSDANDELSLDTLRRSIDTVVSCETIGDLRIGIDDTITELQRLLSEAKQLRNKLGKASV